MKEKKKPLKIQSKEKIKTQGNFKSFDNLDIIRNSRSKMSETMSNTVKKGKQSCQFLQRCT